MTKSPSDTFFAYASVLSLVRQGTLTLVACKQVSIARPTFYYQLAHKKELMDEFLASKKQGKIIRDRRRRSRALREEAMEHRQHSPLFSSEKRDQILEKVKNGAHPIDAALSSSWPETFLRGVITRGMEHVDQGNLESEYAQFTLDLQQASGAARVQASEKVFSEDALSWLSYSPQGQTPNTPRWSKSQKIDVDHKQEIRIVTTWGQGDTSRQLPPQLAPNWRMDVDDDDDTL